MKKIGILGAGTWGLALASVLADNNHQVIVWARDIQDVITLQETKTTQNLKGVILNHSIQYTHVLEQAVADQEIIVLAVPSYAIREVSRHAKPFLKEGQIVVDVAKGLEKSTLYTLSEVIEDEIQNPHIPVVVLSGPTHAEEVVLKMNTAIVAAHQNHEIAKIIQATFSNAYFRVYTNTDVKGIEIAGAVKNIIALASGMLAGIGLGDNAKAALMTRGIAEISRLGNALGNNPHTFYGLAGMGDLIVTCTSLHSRNYRCGKLIGEGEDVSLATQKIGMVVEGIQAIPGILEIALKYNIELPICEMVEKVVSQKIQPKEALDLLFKRDLKSEVIEY